MGSAGLKIGDHVLFRPMNAYDRRKHFDPHGIIVGQYPNGGVTPRWFITRSKDDGEASAYYEHDLTKSRHPDFAWEHGAREFDLYESTVRLRKEAGWPNLKD